MNKVSFEKLDNIDGVPAGFIVYVYDRDEHVSEKELIGRVLITSDAKLIDYTHPESNEKFEGIYYRKPKWYNIVHGETNDK